MQKILEKNRKFNGFHQGTSRMVKSRCNWHVWGWGKFYYLVYPKPTGINVWHTLKKSVRSQFRALKIVGSFNGFRDNGESYEI